MLPVVAGVAGVAAAGVAAYRYLRRKKPTDNPSDAASVETAASSPPPAAVAKAPAKAQTPPAHSGAKTGLITAGIGSAVIGALAFIPVKGMPLWKAAATKAGAYAVTAPVRTTTAVVAHSAASKPAPTVVGQSAGAAGHAAAPVASRSRQVGRWVVVKLTNGSIRVGTFTLGVVSASVFAGFTREFGFEDIGTFGAKALKHKFEVWRTERGEHCIKTPRGVCAKCQRLGDSCTPTTISI